MHEYCKISFFISKKKDLFAQKSKTKKTIFITLITSYGCRENANYHSVVNNQLTLKDLFN